MWQLPPAVLLAPLPRVPGPSSATSPTSVSARDRTGNELYNQVHLTLQSEGRPVQLAGKLTGVLLDVLGTSDCGELLKDEGLFRDALREASAALEGSTTALRDSPPTIGTPASMSTGTGNLTLPANAATSLAPPARPPRHAPTGAAASSALGPGAEHSGRTLRRRPTPPNPAAGAMAEALSGAPRRSRVMPQHPLGANASRLPAIDENRPELSLPQRERGRDSPPPPRRK